MDLVSPPDLPGMAVRRPLGTGPEAPWLARSDDGTWVVVRPGRKPPQLPTHPCLLPVFGAVRDQAGRAWVVVPYRSGSGLDRRLDRVGRTDGDLARACGHAVARALAALHAAGLAHTEVAPHRVLLGGGDQVLLDATCVRPATGGAQAADLAGLADLVEATCAAPGGSLAAVVRAARSGVGAAELADLLRPGSRRRPEPARHARRARAGRTLVGALAAFALLSVASWLGVHLAGRPQPTAVLDGPVAEAAERGPVMTPSPSAFSDWTEVLAGLDRARGAAFAAADPSLLAAVDAAGSPARSRDEALVDALQRGGAVAEGWASHLVSVAAPALGAGAEEVVLDVTDRLSAYVLRDGSGEVVGRQAARGPVRWSVRLVLTSDGWRIAEVARAGGASGPRPGRIGPAHAVR